MSSIVILGAGEIGIALGRVFKAASHSVELWDKNPEVLAALGGESKGLPGIVPAAEFVILCVPSWALREALLYVSPYLSKTAVVISVTKGIETNSLKWPDELLSSLLPKKQPYAVVSGPLISEELRGIGIGGGMIGASTPKAARLVLELFGGAGLIADSSSDRRGIVICGVLKNIYSLALGAADGLGLGDNARGLLTVMAIAEMKKIVSILGGKQETILGLAGLGDLVATGGSSYSQNHEAGKDLASGRISNRKTEGLVSLPSLCIILGDKYKRLPLLSCLVQAVLGEAELGTALPALLLSTKNKI
jgi:glycerol-3-phosphate dehydrogenase (NAD(P)+)